MPLNNNSYFLINKPAGMVSQFTSPDKVRLLGSLNYSFPDGIHAVGRLDNPSEGLLILTTNKKATRLMYSGAKKHLRSYLVMVQNKVSPDALNLLQNGVSIPGAGGVPYIARPESVSIVPVATDVYIHARDEREKYPHTWLLITLTEGKFRQVRKMVIAVRHRCLRLIRVSIAGFHIEKMLPGEVKELSEEDFFKGLNESYFKA
jgi:23S rRNA pseudouridine2457 synthase